LTNYEISATKNLVFTIIHNRVDLRTLENKVISVFKPATSNPNENFFIVKSLLQTQMNELNDSFLVYSD